METEKWTHIKGWEGWYEISNFGNLKSLDRIVLRGSGEMPFKGKMLTWRVNPLGYWYYQLLRKGKKYMIWNHREVAKNFIPNIYNKPEVNHIDGNKGNNHYSNLEWCTRMENIHHAMKLGLWNGHGENGNLSKFTNEQVRKIRSEATGEFGEYSRLARKYSVSPNTMRILLRGESYINV